MTHVPDDSVFESRVRTGVPMVRAAACRTWSEARCACELDALVDAGAHVLVRAATQAASDAEFLDRLLRELPEAMNHAANDARRPAEASR